MPHSIGLGTYLMPREQVASTIRYSILHAGYRRIDCAPVYFNEDAIGDALAELFAQSTIQRSDLYVVSKLPSPFHRNVELAVRKTLNDLRLDYLDLYLGK
jgi:diketogulonate reductase-like aldo/keto reductase